MPLPFIRFPVTLPFVMEICVPSVPSGIGVASRISIIAPFVISALEGTVIVVVPEATATLLALNLGIHGSYTISLLQKKGKDGEAVFPKICQRFKSGIVTFKEKIKGK